MTAPFLPDFQIELEAEDFTLCRLNIDVKPVLWGEWYVRISEKRWYVVDFKMGHIARMKLKRQWSRLEALYQKTKEMK